MLRLWLVFAVALTSFAPLLAGPVIETLPEAQAAGHRCAAHIIALGASPADVAVESAFTECLGSYVRVKTLDAAHEAFGVAFLEAVLDDLGIPYSSFMTPPQSGDTAEHPNLVATLTPSNAALGRRGRETYSWNSDALARPSVILMNHLDVVSVKPEQWEAPELAFSGEVRTSSKETTGEKYLWGRGALDMKGIGMLQLFSLALLKQSSAILDKDIHFLAVADEEKYSSGAIGAVAEIKSGGKLSALALAQVVLGEGGMGVRGAIGSRTTLHLLNNEEKGGAWLRLRGASTEAIFGALERLKLLGKRYRYAFHKRYGCSLVDSQTPDRAANVVASKVVITLRCDRATSETHLREVFETQAKAVKAVVAARGGGVYQVTLQTATSAHGALSTGETLLQGMTLGLSKLGVVQRRSPSAPDFYNYRKTPATEDLLNTIGREETFLRLWGNRYLLPEIKRLGRYLPESLLGKLGGMLYSEGLFRTTCTWSAFDRIDGQYEALVDCRLLRPASSREFLETVRSLVGAVDVQPISLWDFSQSPADNWAIQTIQRTLESERTAEQRVAGTQWLAPNGSDNNFFRNPRPELGQGAFRPTPAYGFFPIVVPTSLVSTQHGSNERFPVAEMAPGVRRYFRALKSITAR